MLLQVVLMSATLDSDLFARYFNGAPTLAAGGRTFPVQHLFLEDAHDMTGYRYTAWYGTLAGTACDFPASSPAAPQVALGGRGRGARAPKFWLQQGCLSCFSEVRCAASTQALPVWVQAGLRVLCGHQRKAQQEQKAAGKGCRWPRACIASAGESLKSLCSCCCEVSACCT